jgi:hypothetical protein
LAMAGRHRRVPSFASVSLFCFSASSFLFKKTRRGFFRVSGPVNQTGFCYSQRYPPLSGNPNLLCGYRYRRWSRRRRIREALTHLWCLFLLQSNTGAKHRVLV